MKSAVIVFFLSISTASNLLATDIQSYNPGDSLDDKIRALLIAKVHPLFFDSVKKVNFYFLEREMVKKYGEVGEEVVWTMGALYFYSKEEIDPWFNLKVKINNKYPNSISTFDLNNDAYLIFERSKKTAQLKLALLWSSKVLEKEPIGNYYDTYANLLYKLGRKVEAVKYQRKALQLDPTNKAISSNLGKMLKGVPTWNN